jgi:hypothetical protein
LRAENADLGPSPVRETAALLRLWRGQRGAEAAVAKGGRALAGRPAWGGPAGAWVAPVPKRA